MDLLSSAGSIKLKPLEKIQRKVDTNYNIYQKYIKRINKFHYVLYSNSIPSDIIVELPFAKRQSKSAFVESHLLMISFKTDEIIVTFYYLYTFSYYCKLDFYLIIRITTNGQELRTPYITTFDSINFKEIHQYLIGLPVQLKLPKYWIDEEEVVMHSQISEQNMLNNSSLYSSKTTYVVEEKEGLKDETFHKQFYNDNKFHLFDNKSNYEILMKTKSKDEKVIENSFTYINYGGNTKSQTYTINTDNKLTITSSNSQKRINEGSVDEDLDAIKGELLDTTNIPVPLQIDARQDMMYGYKAAKVKLLDKYYPCIVKLLIPSDAKCAFSIEETKIRADKAIPIKIIRFTKETYQGEFFDEDDEDDVIETANKSILVKISDNIYKKASSLMNILPFHKAPVKISDSAPVKIPDDVSVNDESLTNKFLDLVNKSILSDADIPSFYSLVKYVLEEEYQAAYSCVMVDNFVYEIGKLITIENFDGELNKVCVPGIHFYFRQEEAFSWHGLPNLMNFQIEHYEKMEQFIPNFIS